MVTNGASHTKQRTMPKVRETCAFCGKQIKPPKRAYCSNEHEIAARVERDKKKKLDAGFREFKSLAIENIDEGEIWKPIRGYEGEYDVSNYGRVRCRGFFQRTTDGKMIRMNPRLLTQQVSKSGYPRVEISKQGIQKKYSVHRLVAEAFIPNPNNKPYVNHIDSNRANARAENLEWVTASENLIHAYKYGHFNPDPTRMIDSRKRKIMRDDGKIFLSVVEAAKDASLSPGGMHWHLKHRTAVPGNGHFYSYAIKEEI